VKGGAQSRTGQVTVELPDKGVITMASESDAFSISLSNIADLEAFIHELHERLGDRQLEAGDDLKERAREFNIAVPDFLEGEPFVYEAHDHRDEEIDGRAIVLVRPNAITNPVAKLRLLCGSWGRVTVCLECGWIWCRIVIYGRF
jgi:hypothetical protein